MGCIYMFTNKINGKAYIGYTKRDLEEREKEHLSGDGNSLLKYAFDKYGEYSFSFDTLEDGIIPEFLPEREKYWIDKFDTVVPNGYNLNCGGKGNLGFKHSKETCKKISETMKGRPAHNKGKKHREETKCKIGNASRGRTASRETRLKMSSNAKNRPSMPCETRQKISNTLKGNIPWNKGKKGIQEAWNKLPRKKDVLGFFLSLSPDIPVKEKRKLIREKFPNIKYCTVWSWVRSWQSEI